MPVNQSGFGLEAEGGREDARRSITSGGRRRRQAAAVPRPKTGPDSAHSQHGAIVYAVRLRETA
jgi:hypothetical protein